MKMKEVMSSKQEYEQKTALPRTNSSPPCFPFQFGWRLPEQLLLLRLMSRVLFHQEVKKKKCLTSLFSNAQTFLSVPTWNLPAAIYGTCSLPLIYFTEDVWREWGEWWVESKSKSADAGSRASHERWFNHFTKDSMSSTTWAEKRSGQRAWWRKN